MPPPTRDADEDETASAASHARARLERHRRLLTSTNPRERATFWDAVALTASSAEQARAFRARLDRLHDARRLPLERERYVVVADPPGGRIGSGGATIRVARELESWFGEDWSSKRVFVLHTGGHSERSPQHGTCGKAFAEIPFDGTGRGIPGTILEAQLAQLTPLAATLPPGVFVSCADVTLEFGNLGEVVSEDMYDAMRRGITALAHPSSVAIGEHHGVFACDVDEVDARVRAMRRGGPPTPLNCKRCLQKPKEDEMRAKGCVMRGYSSGDDEWVLTDSCFHIGVDAIEALIELSKTRGDVLAECEICAYGDFMQPLGSEADASYLEKTGHLASVTSSVTQDAGTRLLAARHAVAEALRGRPLIVIPLLPSRFIHLGTIPEFLHHTTKDIECLRSLPAPQIPVRMASRIPADFKQPEDTAIMLSHFESRVAVGSGTCVLNSDIGADVTIGSDCALYDVKLEADSKVDAKTFMYTLPITRENTGGQFVTIVLNVDDAVKSPTSSTVCGVPVSQAADILGLDAGCVWKPGEARTTTLGRLFPVHDSAEESAREACRMAQALRSAKNIEGGSGDRVSISEALRQFADQDALLERQNRNRRKVIGTTLRALLTTDASHQDWDDHLFDLTVQYEASFMNAENIRNDIFELVGGVTSESTYWDSMRHHLDVARVALSLCVPHANDIAQSCLRTSIARPFDNVYLADSSAKGEPFDVSVAYPARFNLAGGWTDTPPYSLEQPGSVLHVPALIEGERPIVARVSRLDEKDVVRLVMRDEATGVDVIEEVRSVQALFTHRDPTSQFALHKAVVMLFMFPETITSSNDVSFASRLESCFEYGIELRTEVKLPKGSGLGTSSILAFAMVHALLEAATRARWQPLDSEGKPFNLAAQVERYQCSESQNLVQDELASVNVDLDVVVNAVLAVEQLITTGGGWQDQVGGALRGLRLSHSMPGNGERGSMGELPVYVYDTLNVDEHVSRFINRRFACVFTGTCRLAKSVCDSVVTTWQRRDPGVKDALEKCANLARQMLSEYRRLGEYSERDLENGFAGDEEIRRLGALLEEHKLAQQSLWPSIESPTVKAIYGTLSPISYGNFICGAGSGGHVIAFLKPDVGIEDVERAVKACEDAPEARVVRAQLIL